MMRPMTERRKNSFRFDKTITLGSLLAIISITISALVTVGKINEVLFKVDLMWTDYQRRVINNTASIPASQSNEKASTSINPIPIVQ